MTSFDLSHFCVKPSSTIRQAIECIDRNAPKVALVVDDQDKLLDTITDGDVRRAMLAFEDLDAPVSVLRSQKADSRYPEPVTAPVGVDRSSLLRLMQEKGLRQIPLLDEDGRVVGLVTLSELFPDQELTLQAVVMAGGYGTRLRPLTEDLPKPMLPVGGRPLLEIIIDQLREAGIRQVNLTTQYKGEVIARYFGDGQGFGVDIQYVTEDQPMGTAGALSLLETTGVPLLIVNGDILTRVDFRAMFDFHQEYLADMTVAVRFLQNRLPYGVVESDGVRILAINEKPEIRNFINAGIYLLNPEICSYIPKGQTFDMTELVNTLVSKGRRVVGFPIHEYWLDIGQHDDYQQAERDLSEMNG